MILYPTLILVTKSGPAEPARFGPPRQIMLSPPRSPVLVRRLKEATLAPTEVGRDIEDLVVLFRQESTVQVRLPAQPFANSLPLQPNAYSPTETQMPTNADVETGAAGMVILPGLQALCFLQVSADAQKIEQQP